MWIVWNEIRIVVCSETWITWQTASFIQMNIWRNKRLVNGRSWLHWVAGARWGLVQSSPPWITGAAGSLARGAGWWHDENVSCQQILGEFSCILSICSSLFLLFFFFQRALPWAGSVCMELYFLPRRRVKLVIRKLRCIDHLTEWCVLILNYR